MKKILKLLLVNLKKETLTELTDSENTSIRGAKVRTAPSGIPPSSTVNRECFGKNIKNSLIKIFNFVNKKKSFNKTDLR